ncbi:MAG: ion transporter [Anaerolineae bacterium]|jgi:voltage-gated potassium channel
MDQTKANGSRRSTESNGIYDLFIVALTVFSLGMVAAYYLIPLTEATIQALLWIDLPISLIFLADSFGSLRRARDKRAYLKWGWLDFLGSIPFILPLRVARLGRLIRAWRTLRLRRLGQVGEDLDRNRPEGAALITVLLAIVVLTTATVAVLEFESEVPQASIRSAGDAFWWAIVTLATVGYGDYYPVTIWGRVGAIALMTVGIGIFGVLASYLASLFLPKRADDDWSEDLDEIKSELAALNRRLDAIEAMVSAGAPRRPGDSGTEPD